MKRLTTDSPASNTEMLLNFAYAKDKRVTLRCLDDGERDVDLCDYIEKQCRELGFDCCICAPDVMEGSCMECDCVLAVLNSVAIQAAELRERLAMYEDEGPAREKGEWDDSGRYTFADGSLAIRCNLCGAALHKDEWEKYHWHFCPNCGADMRKGENDG